MLGNNESFLELIKFFELIVRKKDEDIEKSITRLEKGLTIVANASTSIAALKDEIEEKSVEVEEQKKETNEILAVLEVENEKIAGEKAIVEVAADEAARKSAQADIDEREANDALAIANPIKKKAKEDAENINPKDLNDFKSPNNPSLKNYKVFKLIYLVFEPEAKMPGDDIKKELPNIKNKVLNASAENIKQRLVDRLNPIAWLTPQFLEKVAEYLKEPWTNEQEMAAISSAVRKISACS